MGSPLVLSLFPGIGLLDMAFEEEGFCVVRGPDLLWGGDVKHFHPPMGKFDGVIGGPPCQAFSTMRHMVIATGKKLAPNLIPEFERAVSEAQPSWFLMENVPDAPRPFVDCYEVHEQMLRDVWVGGVTSRLRRFSFGTYDGITLHVETLALHRVEVLPAALAAGSARPVPVALGGSGKIKRSRPPKENGGGFPAKSIRPDDFRAMCIAQGLPAGFLSDSPLTHTGKAKAVGNGVPLPMGRAIARAVKRAMYPELVEASA